MAALNAGDSDRSPGWVTNYTYDLGPIDPARTTWTVYDADGRVVARGTGERPDGPPDDPADEPHIVG